MTTRTILITGIMAAGKSTVAEHLAHRFPKSVHLRGDTFRRMIVQGRAEMRSDASAEAFAQLELRYKIAAAAADLYLAAGFSVVYQDVIIGPALGDVVSYHRHRPLHVIVLCPSPRAVATRESNRGKVGYHGFAVEELDRVLRAETPRIGLWLDTSDLTVDETVDRIVEDMELSRVS